jgi:hypothetical protein
MARLGETYDRAPGSKVAAEQHSQTTRIDEEAPLPARESICFGDVVAVLFGGVVFCFGVIVWVSLTIGLFDGVIGMQRLAELTTSLGINTIIVWGLLLYSLGRETRSQGKPPRPDLADGLPRLSNRHLDLDTLLSLIGLLASENDQRRL